MYIVPSFQKIIGHSALEISKTKSAKMWFKKNHRKQQQKEEKPRSRSDKPDFRDPVYH